jgi:DNA-binding response OmpR family regulator
MKKILIIEDDPVVSHIYRTRLEKEGFAVEICADGQTGYYRLYEAMPDALLLDLMLPKMNGVDLLKKIRAVREFKKLPVIVLTNAYVTNTISDAFSAGASAVYDKSSISPRQILDALAHVIAPLPAEESATPLTTKAGALVNYMHAAEDTGFQRELMKSFEQSSQAAIGEMRNALQDVSKAAETERACQIEQLYRKVRSFAANASMAGLIYLGKLSAAVEALLKELLEKPKGMTPSTLRTVAQAIDLFALLVKPGLPPDLADKPPVQILVVDDDPLSRRAVVAAMEKAFLKATPVEDPNAALTIAKGTKFDLIFLDVHMPGMDGFTLCDALRREGHNQTTPVIFVTSTTDFQVRTQSVLRGGSDFIAKPFVFIELTVKALTCALRHRLDTVKEVRSTASARPASAPEESAELII